MKVGDQVDCWYRTKWWIGGCISKVQDTCVWVVFPSTMYGKKWASPQRYSLDRIRLHTIGDDLEVHPASVDDLPVHPASVDDLAVHQASATDDDHRIEICGHFNCHEEIYIACTICFVALCYDHADSQCFRHNPILHDEIDDSDQDPTWEPSEESAEILSECTTVIENRVLEADVSSLSPPRKKIKRLPKRHPQIRADSNRIKHPVQPLCRPSCYKKCREHFQSMEHLEKINQHFWSKPDLLSRREYASCFIKIQNVAEHQRDTINTDLRTITACYTLRNENGEIHTVCFAFFQAVFGFAKGNETFTRDLLKRMKEQPGNPAPLPDRRGRHEPGTKKNHKKIQEHIAKYNPSISHYRRAHAPNRLYLPPELNAIKMWHNYQESVESVEERVSSETYRLELRKMNVSFAKLGVEECDLCEEYKQGHFKVHSTFDVECEDCGKRQQHLLMASQAIHAYRNDREIKSETYEIKVSADLMKVLLLPVQPGSKTSIFTPRLVIFNETFALLGKQKGGDAGSMAVVWHEAEAGRTADVVADSFFQFLLANRDKTHITIWADNCAAQNKNFALFTMLVIAVHSDILALTCVTLKFLETGHTFMSADSVHHLFETAIRKAKNIYDFAELVDVFKTVKCCKIKDIYHNDMRKWCDQSSKVLRAKPNHPLLCNMRQIQFRRGSTCLFFKTTHTYDEWKDYNFLKARSRLNLAVPEVGSKGPRGITESKIKAICKKLLPLMPETRRAFWLRIEQLAGNVADLQAERDGSEEIVDV